MSDNHLMEGGVTLSGTTLTHMNDNHLMDLFLITSLNEAYESYLQALRMPTLDTLKSKREKLCLIFAIKCLKHQ